jgi:glycosyltransferase involved in cell wall biosynthesis
MQILFLEPYYGGSHRNFADGLVAHSRHHIQLATLPDRFWKWRLRGAALHWIRKILHPDQFDGLIVSSMLNLADLASLWGPRCPPALVYFHENQLTYPGIPDERNDLQPGFTNITTALAARRVLFNSEAHRHAFLKALPDLLRIMPDYRPNWILSAIAEKSSVAYPGCHFPTQARPTQRDPTALPLIIWNHRWEHDKNPEAFFKALRKLISEDLDFQVALMGEAYKQMPRAFEQAPRILGRRLVQYGYVTSRTEYIEWLARGDVVVSTAVQENFGIAIVEAIRHGCLPLLPNRLSYPEILPQKYHPACLYFDQEDLEGKLKRLLRQRNNSEKMRRELAGSMERYCWEHRIHQFDEELVQLSTNRIDP